MRKGKWYKFLFDFFVLLAHKASHYFFHRCCFFILSILCAPNIDSSEMSFVTIHANGFIILHIRNLCWLKKGEGTSVIVFYVLLVRM